MIDKENKTFGILFNSISYKSMEDLDLFIQNLNKEQAFYCIIQSCKSAIKRNTFDSEETEVLLKSIRLLTTIQKKENESLNESG